MTEFLSSAAQCGKHVTRKRKRKMGIILGCHRVTGTWDCVNAMARNGYAVIRDGRDVRLVWSEAFETDGVQ